MKTWECTHCQVTVEARGAIEVWHRCPKKKMEKVSFKKVEKEES